MGKRATLRATLKTSAKIEFNRRGNGGGDGGSGTRVCNDVNESEGDAKRPHFLGFEYVGEFGTPCLTSCERVVLTGVQAMEPGSFRVEQRTHACYTETGNGANVSGPPMSPSLGIFTLRTWCASAFRTNAITWIDLLQIHILYPTYKNFESICYAYAS